MAAGPLIPSFVTGATSTKSSLLVSALLGLPSFLGSPVTAVTATARPLLRADRDGGHPAPLNCFGHLQLQFSAPTWDKGRGIIGLLFPLCKWG